MTFLGAILVVLSCFCMGLEKTMALKMKVKSFESAQNIATVMTTNICVLRMPMVSALCELAKNFPACISFEDIQDADVACFDELWSKSLECSALDEDAKKILCVAGSNISRGEPPELAMERCRISISQGLEAAREQEQEKGRLYTVLGASAGCMLALVLV